MPSTLRKTQDRAINFSRSLANALRATFKVHSRRTTTSLHPYPYFEPQSHHHFHHQPPPPTQRISRPRQLRRPAGPVIQATPYYHFRHFIQRLPVELLAHIFVLGSEDDPHLPLSVSQVCRSWRYIALSTPSLWRRVVLSPHEYMWRERIRRAKACSLDIELLPTALAPVRPKPLQYHPRRHLDYFSVQWLMQIALPHIHRWRSLEVIFTEQSPYLLNAALSFLAEIPPPPSLKEITIIHRFNEDPQPFVLFGGHAPSVRKLVIDGLRLSLNGNLFANLTFLDYTHHRFSNGSEAVYEILLLLSFTPKLLSLRILFPQLPTNVTPVYHKPPQPTSRINLPSLSQLQLALDPYSADVPYDLALLLTHISTPALHTLKFSDPGRRHGPLPSLKSFFWLYPIPRSLRFIHIEGGWFDPGMVDPIVKSLPRLRKVVVRKGGRGSERVIYHQTQFDTLRRRDRGYHNDRNANKYVNPVISQAIAGPAYQDYDRRHGDRQNRVAATHPYMHMQLPPSVSNRTRAR